MEDFYRYGICVPASCSEEDVDFLIFLMDANSLSDDGAWQNHYHLSKVLHCQDAEGETHDLTPGDKGFM